MKNQTSDSICSPLCQRVSSLSPRKSGSAIRNAVSGIWLVLTLLTTCSKYEFLEPFRINSFWCTIPSGVRFAPKQKVGDVRAVETTVRSIDLLELLLAGRSDPSEARTTWEPSRNKIPFSKLAGVRKHPVLQRTGRYRVSANPGTYFRSITWLLMQGQRLEITHRKNLLDGDTLIQSGKEILA